MILGSPPRWVKSGASLPAPIYRVSCKAGILASGERQPSRPWMAEIYLDRYEALDEVGQGGMAVVYRGTDRVLHRPVAIKVLHPHLSQKMEARARFAREARVIAKLRHPNVVEVFDYSGEDHERSFIIQEFVSGETLADFTHGRDPLLPEIGALLVIAVGKALQHAHEQGVIHRDIKPENIMVRKDGVLKLMDFGIAHVTDMEHLTMTGAIIGSPAHMSPEQVDGKALDARTDIFSLGTLFFMATAGRLPFMADTASGLLKAIADARVPDIRTLVRGFPDDLHLVLLKMMARVPSQRYQSTEGVVGDLEELTGALGLDTDDKQLSNYFKDPEGYSDRVRVCVAERRLSRARGFIREGAYAMAIRELDVTLANDPDNEEAGKALEKARSAARRKALSRTSVLAAVMVGAVLGLGLAAYRFLPPLWTRFAEPVEEVQPPAITRLAPPSLEVMVRPRRQAEEVAAAPVKARPVRVARPGKADGVVVPKKTDLIPVVIQANPPAVRIEVDNVFKGYGTTGRILLPKGRRKVRLSHPQCDICRTVEYAVNLDPSNPLKAPLRYSIGYKDAVLKVHGPPGARVLVNGVPRGRTNRALKIPMRQSSSKQVQVTVREKGSPPLTAQASLSPAGTTVVTVP